MGSIPGTPLDEYGQGPVTPDPKVEEKKVELVTPNPCVEIPLAPNKEKADG
jgi:hypothetical protein